MTGKTRMKLGAHFLFALLLLTLPVAILVTHLDGQRRAQQWVPAGDGVRLAKPDALEQGVAFCQEAYGLSHEGARRLVDKHQRQTRMRLAETPPVAFGTVIDYYSVDGATEPNDARYEGSAQLLPTNSPKAKAFACAALDYAGDVKKPGFADRIRASMKKGYLLVPLAWAGIQHPAAFTNAVTGQVKPMVGPALPRSIAVVATRFPGWYDVSPRSDGDTDANDTGAIYVDYSSGAAQPEPLPAEVVYRQRSLTETTEKWDFAKPGGTREQAYPFSVLDTPSGVFSTTGTWGVPAGTPDRWAEFHPAGVPNRWPTDQNLRDGMFSLLMDPGASSTSASNFFYQQTHGAYRLYGDRTDVVGWLFTAHAANRYKFNTGGGNEFFTFPGTPFFEWNGALPFTVKRATCSDRGCTILFEREVSLGVGAVTISVFQNDTGGATGDTPGVVTISNLSQSWAVMDPYDARRWTIGNPDGSSWQYVDTDDAAEVRDFLPDEAAGIAWSLTVAGFANAGGYTNAFRGGCPQLSNTTIVNSDMNVEFGGDVQPAASRPENRLKSIWYYTHAFIPSSTYQVVHMTNEWGANDDISGTAVPNSRPGYRTHRPAPYDTERDDPWNGGVWGFANEENSGNHRLGNLRSNVNAILSDRGITLPSYNVVVYTFAEDGVGGRVQPESNLDLNEDDGVLTYFHEIAHNMAGAGDLYDLDFYKNMGDIPRPVPPYHECPGMDPYSLMAQGNGRLDEYHQETRGWTVKTTLTADRNAVEIPASEGFLRDPVLIKVPANPYYVRQNVPEASWREYFLVANRNHDPTGAYAFDSSSKGLYILHIDTRAAAKSDPKYGGFQRDDQLLSVMVVESDGNRDLQFNNKGGWGDIRTDPFGADTGGNATGVDRFWQFPMFTGQRNHLNSLLQNVNAAGSPTSMSYGYTYNERGGGVGANVLIPGTETDSFTRVISISNRGTVMTADFYVEPAELVATGKSLIATGDKVSQGAVDFPVMRLTLENPDGRTARRDMRKMSTRDVFIDGLRVLESGTSNNAANITAVKLFADGDNDGVFEPPSGVGHDTMIASTTIQPSGPDQERAVYSNLNYRVPLGESRNLFIAYDIADEAQTNPRITVGAEFTDVAQIEPRLPGSVQSLKRLDPHPSTDQPDDYYNFGPARFPFGSNTAVIIGYPDRLLVTADTSVAPGNLSEGQQNIPMLGLVCAVNPSDFPRAAGSARIDSINVNHTGTVNAPADLTNCRLVLDVNGDGQIDGGDTLLGDSNFAPFSGLGANGQASFTNLNLPVQYGQPRRLLIAVSVATGIDTSKNVQLSIEFPTPGAQPQDCYIQLVNNPSEPDASKDFVEYRTGRGAVWPLRSSVVSIRTVSRTLFTDASGNTVTAYEENDTIHVRVRDVDQNRNIAAPDTLTVTVTANGGDSEVVTLTETGNSTGVFRGSIASIGRAGLRDDGTLNAIGGSSGNQLTATYVDPLDPILPPDSSIATAMLNDTIAPAIVARKLVVTSGPHGRSALLDWTLYDENAQIDVAGYHVWQGTSDFTDTAGQTLVTTVPAGTETFEAPSLLPNHTYYFAVTAFDEVPNERSNVIARRIVTKDTTAPTVSDQVPAAGATGVPVSTPISFFLNDPGVGVDRGTIVVTVTEDGLPVGFGSPVLSGTNLRLQVTVTPTSPLHWNSHVVVSVDAADLVPNSGSTTWDFFTTTDAALPTIDQQVPAPNATGVSVSTNISFHAKDPVSGIDQSRTQVLLDGGDISGSLTFTGSINDTTVTHDPPPDLEYNHTYVVTATVYDFAGNQAGPVSWSFTTASDNVGVQVDQFDPARNATGVPINTNIAFRLTDQQAGIDLADLRVWVQGLEVTSSLQLTVSPSLPAVPTLVQVVYDPPEDLPYATDIAVRVFVDDEVDNITDLTYSFRTVDTPVYNIAGVITDTNDLPLAGVTVTAGALTAISDGNGGYRISGLLAGTYTVTPSRAQYVFTPDSQSVTVGPDDANGINFEGRLLTFAIRGRVTEGTAGLAGVTISWGTPATVTTGADGRYVIPGLPVGNYTVTPGLTNYSFDPASRVVDVDENESGVSFRAIPDTFSVSGQVTDSAGNRLQGVRVSDESGDHVAVTNAAGQYVMTGLRAATYQLRASKSGYGLQPSVHEVTVPPDRTDVDFVAFVEMSSTFSAGTNFIGVPGTPLDTNPQLVFGGAPTFRYNPAARPPVYLSALDNPTAEIMQVKPGRGFFVKFDATTVLAVPGVPTDPSRTYSIGLADGWNMIANPMGGPTAWSNFVPSSPDSVKPFAFVYDNSTGSYLLVADPSVAGSDRSSLLPWEGAWVRAVGGGSSLQVSGGAGVAAEAQPAKADLRGGWLVPVVARAAGRADLSAVAGAIPGTGESHTMDNPPPAPATVDVYFVDAAGRRLAHDIRSQAGAQTFDFVVACGLPDVEVTVALPDLSQVGADKQVLLVDQEAGKTLYARTLPSYSYQSRGQSSLRHFQLVVGARSVGSLTISTAGAAARTDGVVLTYGVSQACRVSVNVTNLAGRRVRGLVGDKTVAGGLQTELWNLQSDNGTRVPAGTYLLQIEAAAENGQRVRALATVQVGR